MDDKTNKPPPEQFSEDCRREIDEQGKNEALLTLSRQWMDAANAGKYSYHFRWLGRPIIQYPHDIIAMQEILWSVKPDLVIETGVAHGGSLIFYASILELIGAGEVIGIDIDIRPHNRMSIQAHPMFKRVRLIEGSSTAPDVIALVRGFTKGKRVLVVLDSNHTHDHVFAELEAYAPLVGVGSYCVVMDTVIEHLPVDSFVDRPWGRGNNALTAVAAYLKGHPEFEVDREIDNKLLVSVAPGGYLRRLR